jgi:hypothetical protein
MIVFENKWETFEAFDFGSLITAEDCDRAKTDIQNIIASGNYFKNSPPYQTMENIFLRQDEHWMKFKMTFILSCFMYLKQEAKIKNIQAWSFMTSNKTQENRDTHWHTHQYANERTLSGLFYLHIPDDADKSTSGTEFAINGVDQPERWVSPVIDYHWLIYPGKTWHRPMPPQSSNNRFVIAADMIF